MRKSASASTRAGLGPPGGITRCSARDGVAIRDEAELTITALKDSELVLVDAA